MATTKVELYNGATLVATKTSAPFTSIDWTPVTTGAATLTAKRYEDGVLVATSSVKNYTVNAAAGDTTAPTMSSATVEDANPSTLVVVFSEVVTITDVTGLTIAGAATPTLSAPTGSGTNTLSFTLSAPLTNGQTVTLEVAGTNNIIDGASNALVAVSQPITNNVAAASGLALVSSYPMTETTGNMIDTVSAINGTVSGVTRDGVKYAFDGVNNSINIPYNINHVFLNAGASRQDVPFEIEMNILFNDLTNVQYICTKKPTSTTGEYYIVVSSAGFSIFLAEDGGSTVTIGRRVAISDITTGVEYLAKFAYDGSKNRTGLSITLDGVRKDTLDAGAATYLGMANTNADTYVGSVNPVFNTGLKFNGTIRDLKLKK